ncbi:hypothetical protein Salat_0949500 [Sesamum alatum]|uniref:Uncharacterized protein n=1 Tax=Sesamum alatum TaxID=300844 RepID=A0AAE1YKV3_9LAMI|nr:hypothetical protein Salat_0949500 [Sesamum alatum]
MENVNASNAIASSPVVPKVEVVLEVALEVEVVLKVALETEIITTFGNMVKINDAIKYSNLGASRCEGSSNIEPSSLIDQKVQDCTPIEPSSSDLLDEESPLKKICI